MYPQVFAPARSSSSGAPVVARPGRVVMVLSMGTVVEADSSESAVASCQKHKMKAANIIFMFPIVPVVGSVVWR